MDGFASKIDRRDIWIMSPARCGRFAIDRPGTGKKLIKGREYHISGIGRYLLSPKPLTIIKRLVGCEIHEKPHPLARWIAKGRHPFTKSKPGPAPPLTLHLDLRLPSKYTVTENLNRHLQAIYEKTGPLDDFYQTLENLNLNRVAKVVGICEDDAGYRSPLLIDGDTSAQMDYVIQNAGQQVGVRLKRACVADGLFEMKGFDFQKYDPKTIYRLIRFEPTETPKACVLDSDDTVAFWVDDAGIITYLQLLEFCIQQHRQMYESFYNCIKGKAIPIRVMFNPKISIDYSRAPLPDIFDGFIADTATRGQIKKLVREYLNTHQIGVSFNSLAQQRTGASELCTDIAILQNLRALAPIRDRVPVLYAEMDKRAADSEGEKFYLLETIRGVNHAS